MKEEDYLIRRYVECECGVAEHRTVFVSFHDDEEKTPSFFVETHLDQRESFFRRLWNGLRYIFGQRDVLFTESWLSNDKVKELRDFCNDHLDHRQEEACSSISSDL